MLYFDVALSGTWQAFEAICDSVQGQRKFIKTEMGFLLFCLLLYAGWCRLRHRLLTFVYNPLTACSDNFYVFHAFLFKFFVLSIY